MEKTLYLECASGISGDMTVAALLDLGIDRAPLDAALASLPLDGCRVEVARVKKAGLDCCDFRVHLDAAHENHDHDMAYLHGHDHGHDHGPGHHDHAHPHEHRGMPEIRDILARCAMTEGAQAIAMRVFDILARAESKAHGVAVDDVHFHEVGAIDSIIDIVAAAVCLDALGAPRVVVPELCEGRGTVRCQHGVLPVPVPAVANIVAESGLRLRIGDVRGELVTPTGAAIAAAVRTDEALPRSFRILRTGLGAGKRDYEPPSILRAMLIEPTDDGASPVESVCRMECDIDDATGEELGFAMERLFSAGALDVNYAPVFMKKNRPGWRLTLLCPPSEAARFASLVLSVTPSIGVRWSICNRRVLPRSINEAHTPWGAVRVKDVVPDGASAPRRHAEYEDVARIARANGLPFRTVADAALHDDAPDNQP